MILANGVGLIKIKEFRFQDPGPLWKRKENIPAPPIRRPVLMNPSDLQGGITPPCPSPKAGEGTF